jgi:hypothetical protein
VLRQAAAQRALACSRGTRDADPMAPAGQGVDCLQEFFGFVVFDQGNRTSDCSPLAELQKLQINL